MPRVALTEEAGIILARHLKSRKRRTPFADPLSLQPQAHGSHMTFRLGVFATSLHIHVSKNRAKPNIFELLFVIS